MTIGSSDSDLTSATNHWVKLWANYFNGKNHVIYSHTVIVGLNKYISKVLKRVPGT